VRQAPLQDVADAIRVSGWALLLLLPLGSEQVAVLCSQ